MIRKDIYQCQITSKSREKLPANNLVPVTDKYRKFFENKSRFSKYLRIYNRYSISEMYEQKYEQND